MSAGESTDRGANRSSTTTVFAVVIGGGPAGAATALLLARAGCDVVLLEKQPTTGWKIGETLPPEAKGFLRDLGVWDRFVQDRHLPCYGIVSAWGQATPIDKDFIFNPNGHGWQLDRALFEQMLLSAATEAGCRVCFGQAVESITPQANGWLVKTAEQTIDTSWLIDCSGRGGKLLSQVRGDYEALDQLVAVFARASSNSGADQDARTYVESFAGGWIYTALTPSGARTVAIQSDRDLVPQDRLAEWFHESLQACPEICRLLEQLEYRFHDAPRMVNANSGRFRSVVGEHWIVAGDAAMSFDPLCGQGSLKALASAFDVSAAILSGADYLLSCDQLWQNFVAELSATYGAEARWPQSQFWMRRHAIA